MEDQLELTDRVKVRLHESHREIAAGQFTTRHPQWRVAAALQIFRLRLCRAVSLR